jgi:hypothetical protein
MYRDVQSTKAETMRREQRATQRHRLGSMAKIQSRLGSLPRDCWVSDISDGGVRLVIEGMDVPTDFVLLLEEPRNCRVVWRLGCELGAEFVDKTQKGFAQRIAGRQWNRSAAAQ